MRFRTCFRTDTSSSYQQWP